MAVSCYFATVGGTVKGANIHHTTISLSLVCPSTVKHCFQAANKDRRYNNINY